MTSETTDLPGAPGPRVDHPTTGPRPASAGVRISALDRMWTGGGDVSVVGPIALPSLEQLRAAAVVLAEHLPEARIGRRLDVRRGRWTDPGLSAAAAGEDAVVELTGVDPDRDGFAALARRAAALRPDDVPVRWVLAGDHLALAVSHAVGDAALQNLLLGALPHLALTGELPEAPPDPVVRHPLTAALVHRHGRHPLRIASAVRGRDEDGAGGGARAEGAGGAVLEPSLTVVHAVATAPAAADLRAWRRAHAPDASLLGLQTHLVRQALLATGLDPEPGFVALFDVRAHLPRGGRVVGNFSVGLDLEVAGEWSPAAVDAAVRAALETARPLHELARGALREGARALVGDRARAALRRRRTGGAGPVPSTLSRSGRPLITMSLTGRDPVVEALPWLRDARTPLFAGMTTPIPEGVTVSQALLHQRRQTTFSFHDTVHDAAAMQRAVDLVAHDPVAALEHRA